MSKTGFQFPIWKREHKEKERGEGNTLNVDGSCLDGGILMMVFILFPLQFSMFSGLSKCVFINRHSKRAVETTPTSEVIL